MKRHAVDFVSLVFGAFFLVVAGIFLSAGFDAFEVDVRWIWPAALVVIGLAFLVPSRRLGRQSSLPDSATDAISSPEVEAAKQELFPSPLD